MSVYSQNDNISTTDSSEIKLFGSNLLLPQNNNGQLSNFFFQLGRISFAEFETYSNTPLLDWKRVGAYLKYNSNNNLWLKDSISVPVTINSFEAGISYLLVDAELNDSNENLRILMTVGYVNRRIGSDYGLKSNKELRELFLGTTKLGFDGYKLGVRLEIGKFFGQYYLYSFGNSVNIAGFGGHRGIVSLGIKADLDLAGKNADIRAKFDSK
jgi:hypothetical protein